LVISKKGLYIYRSKKLKIMDEEELNEANIIWDTLANTDSYED